MVWLEDDGALWCWNERGGFTFQSVGGGEHVCSSGCVSPWNCDLIWIFGLFGFFGVVGGGGGV